MDTHPSRYRASAPSQSQGEGQTKPEGERQGQLPPSPPVPWPLRSEPWSLSASETSELYRALRFEHFKWDTFSAGGFTLLPEVMVVPEALHTRVVDTVEALSRGLAELEVQVQHEPELLDRLGIPRALHPVIAADTGPTFQCARYDLFPCEDGRLMVSEFNEDVPGGFNEAVGLPDLLGDPGAGRRWESGLREALVSAFSDVDGIALLHATSFSEDLQHMLILEKWFREAGHRTVLASPAHLTHSRWRGPRVLGTPVEGAFRFYPGEWMPRLPNFPVWSRALPRLRMMNPLRHMIRQSKKVFELWWELSANAPDVRALLDAHSPRTWTFAPEWHDCLRTEPERWVLKRVFGRMGDAVVMGSLVSSKVWEDTLREAAQHPREWCVQECFTVSRLAFNAGEMYPTLGAYVVQGRFAGYYSRVAPRPFLTHEALHVATVLDVS
jgi:glutathionylspermidine synthase